MGDIEIIRRVRLSDSEIKILAALTANLTGVADNGLHSRLVDLARENGDPEHQRLVATYRSGVPVCNLTCELDDDGEVSLSDSGAYVQVWTWVDNSNVGLPSAYDEDEEPEVRHTEKEEEL